jgi:serine/threonine protein kinase
MLGQILNNRYKVTDLLGEGAMGEVYRASDLQTGQAVAIKVITQKLALDSDFVERFRREGEALRQLRHANIVAFVEMFRYGQQHVIVMEYVDGGSLHKLIRQGPLPWNRAVRIALELCDALTQAHHIHIIHRDIKPENVLLTDADRPKLTDFGIARLVNETGRLTGTSTQMGTPYYMSPEAWEGKPLEEQADIWSLGVVLYEMVTGQLPFQGDTLVAVMNKVLTTPPPDLTKVRGDVPPPLARVIGRMLARNAAARYGSIREVALDLERIARGQTVETNPPSSSKPARRSYRGIAVLGIIGLALIGLAGLASVALVLARGLGAQRNAPLAAPTATATSTPAPVPSLTPAELALPAPTTPNPHLTAYDPFDKAVYDNAFNPALWQGYTDEAHQIHQQNGILIIRQVSAPQQGTALTARRYAGVVLDAVTVVEARLKLDSKEHPTSQQDSGGVHLTWNANTADGKDQWVAMCELIGDTTDRAGVRCHDWWNDGAQGTSVMEEGRVNYGEWYKFRIEIDPATMRVTYFIEGDEVGSFVPVDAEKLKTARFSLNVEVWTNSADPITGYVDDVYLSPK